MVICLFRKQTPSYPRPRLTLVKIELSGRSRKGKVDMSDYSDEDDEDLISEGKLIARAIQSFHITNQNDVKSSLPFV